MGLVVPKSQSSPASIFPFPQLTGVDGEGDGEATGVIVPDGELLVVMDTVLLTVLLTLLLTELLHEVLTELLHEVLTELLHEVLTLMLSLVVWLTDGSGDWAVTAAK
jgi:hypothetical protein